MTVLPAPIDHLVLGTPDLAYGVEHVERHLGVRSEPGGRHPNWGTRNALIGLGAECYLEIIGPDPALPDPDGPRPFGIDQLTGPRLVTWAAKGAALDQLVARGQRVGLDLGSLERGTRRRPDGLLLRWQLTDVFADRAGGIVPFFIDWGNATHPAASLAQHCSLLTLRAEHPDADGVRTMLEAIAIPLPVVAGSAAALIATIRTPSGTVELR